MRTRLAPADNDRAVGVAWFLREIGGVTIQYHGGAAIGQQGVLMLAPERSAGTLAKSSRWPTTSTAPSCSPSTD